MKILLILLHYMLFYIYYNHNSLYLILLLCIITLLIFIAHVSTSTTILPKTKYKVSFQFRTYFRIAKVEIMSNVFHLWNATVLLGIFLWKRQRITIFGLVNIPTGIIHVLIEFTIRMAVLTS